MGSSSIDLVFRGAELKRREVEQVLSWRGCNFEHYSCISSRKSWPLAPEDPTAQMQLNNVVQCETQTDPVGEAEKYIRSPIKHHFAEFSPQEDVLYASLGSTRIIRVLEILPGEFREPIVSTFRYADLDSPVQIYEALSYVWGYEDDSFPARSLTCDGHKVSLRQNLFIAIRYLRSETKSRYIWADAICINQADDFEKGHQISMMGSVYSKAAQVIVWLGEVTQFEWPRVDLSSNVRAGRAFEAICDIVNDWSHKTGAKVNAHFSMDSEEQDTSSSCSSPISDKEEATLESCTATSYPPHWQAVADLFRRPWFWRLWIVQEVVLASNATFKWGDCEISWKWVGLAAAILRTNYHHFCSSLDLGGIYNAYLMFRLSPMSDLPTIQLSFYKLLSMTRQFGVTDPRDRIYGLLGIPKIDSDDKKSSLTQREPFLQPDYRISAEELCKVVTWKIILRDQDLSILSSVQHEDDAYARNIDESRPSWIPDWGASCRGATLAAWDMDDRFNAAKGFPLRLGDEINTEKLIVEGILIGVVGFCGHSMDRGPDERENVRLNLDLSLLSSDSLADFFGSEKGLRLLAKTLQAGRDSYGSLVGDSDSYLTDFAAYLIGLESILDLNQESSILMTNQPGFEARLKDLASQGRAARFEEVTKRVCMLRRLFITINGHFGIAPSSIREGDIICVLSGADLPFVLRPNGDRDTAELPESVSAITGGANGDFDSTGNTYRLVGECYVDSLMDGQGLEALAEPGVSVGPVPPDDVVNHILGAANEDRIVADDRSSKYWGVDEFAARKMERVNAGKLFNLESFERYKEMKLRKRWVTIT